MAVINGGDAEGNSSHHRNEGGHSNRSCRQGRQGLADARCRIIYAGRLQFFTCGRFSLACLPDHIRSEPF